VTRRATVHASLPRPDEGAERAKYACCMTAKERLRQLADELSEQDAAAALVLVETGLHDPMLAALAAAPEDDEPTTPDEDESAREGYAAYKRGEAVPLDEVKRELDID
jgi:hypothetical protein